MTTSNFIVRELFSSTATRPNGMAARQMIKKQLGVSDQVVVDLTNVVLTPSFADEFLGVLLAEIGDAEFRRGVKIINVPPSARSLLKQVLTRRAVKPNLDVEAHNALHQRQVMCPR